MSSFKATGVIIRRSDYAEADKIYSIITKEGGVVEAIAKGVRKSTAKLGAHLELFGEIDLMFAKGRNLDIITSARLINAYRNITEDYELLRRGFLFCEILNKLTKQTANSETYGLLVECLGGIDGGISPSLAELYFKLCLLDQLGYKPNLEQNIKSKTEILAHKKYHFSSEGGGLVESHEAQTENLAIGIEHIKLWRLILKHNLVELGKLKGIDKPAVQSLPIANDFYDYLFGKRFKSSEI